MFRYVYLFSLGYHQDSGWSAVSCFMYELVCITLPQAFHTASNWLTLGRCGASLDPEVNSGLGQDCQPRDISIFVSPTSPSNGVQCGGQSWESSRQFSSPPATSPPGPVTGPTELMSQVAKAASSSVQTWLLKTPRLLPPFPFKTCK